MYREGKITSITKCSREGKNTRTSMTGCSREGKNTSITGCSREGKNTRTSMTGCSSQQSVELHKVSLKVDLGDKSSTMSTLSTRIVWFAFKWFSTLLVFKFMVLEMTVERFASRKFHAAYSTHEYLLFFIVAR